MRELLRKMSEKQHWQAESRQGFKETKAGVHSRPQAEAGRHGYGRLSKGNGAEEHCRLQQDQGCVLDPIERYRGDITVYLRQ